MRSTRGPLGNAHRGAGAGTTGAVHRSRLGSGPIRSARLVLARHRRPLMVLILLSAVWVTIRTAAPPAPTAVPVIVAARDLAAGAVLRSGDLHVQEWPTSIAPSARIAEPAATGRVLATAVAAGEAITRSRLLGPGLLAGQPPDAVAVTIRVTDPASLAPIHAGDRVDVLAVTGSGEPPGQAAAERIAAGALVLARPAEHDASDDQGWSGGAITTGSGQSASTGSGVLVLAADGQTAAQLAGAAGGQPLSVVLLGPADMVP